MWIQEDEYTVEVYDENLQNRVFLDLFESLDLVFKFNDVGAWSLVGSNEDLNFITWSSILQFKRNNELMMTGLVESFDRKFTSKVDSLAISGVDTNALLKRRVTYPDPTEDVVIAPDYKYSTAFDTRTGTQEKIMKEYVQYNLGPNALSIRQNPFVTLQTNAGLGDTLTWYARFENLLELLQELAIPVSLTSEELGFDFGGTNGFEFQVYQPRDLTSSAVFSMELGTILSFEYGTAAPDANYIIAGGKGEDANRIFYSYGDTSSISQYRFREMFHDASSIETATELYPIIVQKLFENADKTSIKVEPADLPWFKFWDDYRVGDKVTSVIDGTEIEDIIRIVEFNLSTSGVQVKPTIGKNESYYYALSRIFERIRSVDAKASHTARR